LLIEAKRLLLCCCGRGAGRREHLPSRRAALCDQLGDGSGERDGTEPPTPARLQRDAVLRTAEADPAVKSYWYQAQDFSGTSGELRQPPKPLRVTGLEDWIPPGLARSLWQEGTMVVFFSFYLLTSVPPHSPYPRTWSRM